MTTAQYIPHLAPALKSSPARRLKIQASEPPSSPTISTSNTAQLTSNTSAADTPSFSEEDILSGSSEAFEQLVHKESPRLFSMILRIVRDEDEARSILQETYLQSLERLPTFRGESKLTTWIYSIGLNLARAARRKSSRLRVLTHEEIDAIGPAFTSRKMNFSPRPWDLVRSYEKSERKHLVQQAIERLPEQHRLIVQLKDIDGWATEDVSSMLNISHVAVRVRLHRARQALRVLLAPYFAGTLVS